MDIRVLGEGFRGDDDVVNVLPVRQADAIIQAYRDFYASWGPAASFAEMRRRWESFACPAPMQAEVEEVDADGVPCRLVSAAGASAETTVLFLHGGGYQIGSTASHHDIMASISRKSGFKVLGVDYRLAPEHRFPAAFDDCVTVYRWLTRRTEAGQIAVCGESAGGGLAVAVTAYARDNGMPLPRCIVALSPWVDMEAAGASYESNANGDPISNHRMMRAMARAYLGREQDPRDPRASPLHGSLVGLPPMFIQVGDSEVLLDDSRALAAAAAAQGVPVTLRKWSGVFHTFQLFPSRFEEADAALDEVATFLKNVKTD